MCNHHSGPPGNKGNAWHSDDNAQPAPLRPNSSEIYRPDILETIETEITRLDDELRELSLDIHCMIPLLFWGDYL